MKLKTIVLIIISIIIMILVNNKNESIIIPKESIRIRIIANTNNEIDINDKIKVKKNVERELYSILKTANNVNEAKKLINDNLDKLNIVIDNIIDYNYNINYGYNYFPRKTYKGVIYEPGNYESLVITLGEGNGNNWWCVLFPPLCLLDENNQTDNVKYKFFVKEMIDKFK